MKFGRNSTTEKSGQNDAILVTTGMWLLGFRWDGGRVVSHIYTEGDRKEVPKNCENA
jgi:hypothetical protein